MNRRRAVLLVPLLALSMIAGACGGGGGGSSSAYCKKIRDVAKEAQRTTSTSAANMQALENAFDKALSRIADKAPSEIKDDYNVIKQYVDLRFAAVINQGQGDNAAKATALLPKYTTAQKNITDYNKKVCKYSPTTPTTVRSSATTATTAASTTSTSKK